MNKVQIDASFIASPLFQSKLSGVIERFKTMLQTSRAEAKKKDLEIKRNSAVALADEGNMNVDFVCKEYIAISKLQSSLSSGKRQVIKALVGEAAIAALQERAAVQTVAQSKQEENGNENPSPQSETPVV